MKRISWESAKNLINECGCLNDGVVTAVHGHMMTLSVCTHLDEHPGKTFWVVELSEVSDFYGVECSDALKAADWITAVCFENEAEAMLWFTNNVHKRLLMRELHDQDLITFLSTVPEQQP